MEEIFLYIFISFDKCGEFILRYFEWKCGEFILCYFEWKFLNFDCERFVRDISY